MTDTNAWRMREIAVLVFDGGLVSSLRDRNLSGQVASEPPVPPQAV